MCALKFQYLLVDLASCKGYLHNLCINGNRLSIIFAAVILRQSCDSYVEQSDLRVRDIAGSAVTYGGADISGHRAVLALCS